MTVEISWEQKNEESEVICAVGENEICDRFRLRLKKAIQTEKLNKFVFYRIYT